MAEQQSRLAIVIDSTGAQRNAEGLSGALAKMTQAGQRAAESSGKVTKATDDEGKALSALLDKIDPVNAALNRLDEQQRQLAKFQAKGFLDTETFNDYSKKIEQTRNGLSAYATDAGKAGMSSKQLAANMRMVPAQMTDIVVSLASGQAPLTVLLQQGGQLKDMFGGIGPAAKALGTYVAGLVNPFTLAAAEVGVLALAYYQGSEEQQEFYKSLVLTGNIAGITAGQLSDMANQVAKVTGSTVGKAASVLNQVVASGKIAGDSLQAVTTTIVNMSKATGQSTDGMIGDFERLSKDPVEAISKLNEQYHFLSAETYNRIKQLQDEGNATDAARLATMTYSNEINRRSTDIRNNLSDLEKAWDGVWSSASKAWDAMRDSGRSQTPESKLKTLEESLSDAQKRQAEGGLINRFVSNTNGYDIPRIQKQIAEIKSQITTQNVLNDALSDYQNRQDKAIKAQQFVNELTKDTLTNAQKRTKEQEKLTKAIKDGAQISAAQEKALRANIDDKYKDPKTPKTKAYRDDAGQRLLLQLQQQQATLVEQESTGYKIGTQQQALIKWEQQLADIKSKQTLTADQKSLLASADRITAQLQQNAAIEKEIQSREKLLALDKARADINRTIANRQSQYSTEELFSSGGMSQYDQQQYTQRLSLEQSYNDKITQLRQQRASATSDIAREEIDQEIELQRQALSTELSNYDSHMEGMNASRRSFTAGASRAWQEYQDSAANVSAMSQQLFSNAFSGMEDALVNFAVSGKASFRDFANSVISDLARIAARQAITGLVGSLFSAGVSGASGAAASPSSGSTGALGMSTSFRAYAKGGVPGGNSISDYRNGVYDSPQFFAFAKGAGVFGEAGPEAIMPLARGSDGSLGVRMVSNGGGGGTGVTVNAPVSIVQNSSDTGSVNTANTAASAKMLQSMITQTINDWAKKAMSPGGNLYNGGRG